jgi:hypothetical protein
MLAIKPAVLVVLATALLTASAAAAPPGTKELRPNDPGYVQNPRPYDQIDAPAFWAATADKVCTTKIAVLDSTPAAILDLPTLQPGASFASGSGNTSHGTEVASVAAAGIDNGVGVAGLTDCPVVPGRVMDASGVWLNAWLAPAIDWAVGQGVRVINVSLWQRAGEASSPTVTAAIERATASGVLVVLIAGNGTNNDLSGSASPAANPLAAANPAAIRVAGADPDGAIHPASNRGSALADIAAPFTIPVNLPDERWVNGNGTSYSAPAVAAVAAELFDLDRSLTPAQVKSMLMGSGRRVAGLDVGCGCVLNAYGALLAAGYTPATSPQRFRLVVRKAGAGRGTVVGAPVGIRCGARCSAIVARGRSVRLTAKPGRGSRFVGWRGACRGSRATCTLRVTGNTIVTASFARRGRP